ncbi:DUF2628 domain-containing protein [Pseudomonas huanghezhanensis]|uniref:DUF2628 domain-containing protein n=1 Tax=Pseudomonas huanghezhanensis TaxID=3002903 RepID=UPI002286B2FB|nr:DUF2628 domain-containing protein [Pseudomonas sp. BSw22131]
MNTTETEQQQSTRTYSDKWQERFDFFASLEQLDRKEQKAAAKALPFTKKIGMSINFTSLFFGAIHMTVLGMWRINLTLIAMSIIAFILLLLVLIGLNLPPPRSLTTQFISVVSLCYGSTTNYAYYLKEVKGYNGWNPFKRTL